MKRSEWFTISMSFLALLMSATAFYLEFFHVEHQVSISSYNIINRDKMSFADVAISNDGDKSIAITNLHFFLAGENASSFEAAQNRTYVKTYVNGVYSDIVLSDVPLTLAGGDTILVRLSSSFDFSNSNEYFKESSFNIGIQLEVYTSTAKMRNVGIVPFWTKFSGGRPYYPSRGEQFESEKQRSWNL